MPILRCLRAVLLVLLCGVLPGCSNEAPSSRAAVAQAARARIAQAKFEAYCKRAGEKITRTVEGVDGVFLLKLRPQERNFGKQFVMDDPYGDDSNGDRYIESFLGEKIHHDTPITTGGPLRNGYRYIDALGEDGQRYRYTGAWKDVLITGSVMSGYYGKQWYSRNFVLDKTLAKDPAPRYGVTYDDISTHEDREYWIAGSSLRVIDLKTNEVIAERIGYMWDPGQGGNSGGRSPWAAAADYACPGFIKRFGGYKPRVPAAVMQELQTEDFVEKVLIPKVEK